MKGILITITMIFVTTFMKKKAREKEIILRLRQVVSAINRNIYCDSLRKLVEEFEAIRSEMIAFGISNRLEPYISKYEKVLKHVCLALYLQNEGIAEKFPEAIANPDWLEFTENTEILCKAIDSVLNSWPYKFVL